MPTEHASTIGNEARLLEAWRMRFGVVGLVASLMLTLVGCKKPCEKWLDAVCEADTLQCQMGMEMKAQFVDAAPERQRECSMQLEELERFPRPHTRMHIGDAVDRMLWRTQVHPAARVAGLPAGYASFDWLWQDVFSSVLAGAGETALPAVPGDSFRFAWAPSLRGTAFVVRATHSDAGASIEWKRLDQPGETPYHQPSHVGASTRRALSVSEWGSLALLMHSTRGLPSRSPRAGEDGSMWLLETVTDGGYSMVLRWSPEEDSDPEFREACLSLVALGTPDGGFGELDF